MKILHLSDTHSKHRQLKNLPKADLIIHSGDASENGTESEILDFLDWFCDLDYQYKIFVAGNHDLRHKILTEKKHSFLHKKTRSRIFIQKLKSTKNIRFLTKKTVEPRENHPEKLNNLNVNFGICLIFSSLLFFCGKINPN